MNSNNKIIDQPLVDRYQSLLKQCETLYDEEQDNYHWENSRDTALESRLNYLAVICGNLNKVLFSLGVRDACQVCHGESGGVPGNENVCDGVIMCDYCSSARFED